MLFTPITLRTNPILFISTTKRLFSSLPSMPQGKRKKANDGAPKKPPLTHFLCIPLVNPGSKPQLEASIKSFKEDVCAVASAGAAAVTEITSSPEAKTGLENRTSTSPQDSKLQSHHSKPKQQDPLIAEKAIRPVGSLHLTLGVMSLDAETLAKATLHLQTLDLGTLLQNPPVSSRDIDNGESEETSEPKNPTIKAEESSIPTETPPPLTLTLTSLHPMHPPQKTSILYTSPSDPTHRLKPLCLNLRNSFQKAGFLKEDNRPLKLHATLVNTIYATKKKGGRRNGRKGKKGDDISVDPTAASAVVAETTAETKPPCPSTAKQPSKFFDAREILQRYEKYIWAEDVVVDRIAVCEMGVKRFEDGDDGTVGEERYREVCVRYLV